MNSQQPQLTPDVASHFASYTLADPYDEMFDGAGAVRPPYAGLLKRLQHISLHDLQRRQSARGRAPRAPRFAAS